LPKDVAALIGMGQEYGYGAPLLRGARQVNLGQRRAVLRKLQRGLKVLKGRRVAVLGLAFKAHTDDLRESPALELIEQLHDAGALVTAYDPAVKIAPAELDGIRMVPNAYDAADRADALVVVTDWPEFAELDLRQVAGRMDGDLLVDGRNLIDPDRAARAGLRLVGVGTGG
jgi:nucleotide sugar dehydrogenase